MHGDGVHIFWPTGQNPYFIRPDGMSVHLAVENYMPYLFPTNNHCKPCKPTGSMSFRCATPVISPSDSKSGEPGVAAHAHRPESKTQTKKCRVERCAVPSDTESDAEVPDLVESSEDEKWTVVFGRRVNQSYVEGCSTIVAGRGK